MLLERPERNSWLNRPLFGRIQINVETLLWAVLVVLAIFSRFYILGARVMSHDENSHVYYSWRFYKGEGFAHDPLMHGPLQFHLLAASYFMFGDNDFTARIPAALFSVATVIFIWYYRRYFGSAGALIAGFLMLISPYILYYGRYARNEAFVGLFGVIMLWAILRYLETGKPIYLYTLTAVTALHFTAKETAFIYTAQALIFLTAYFIYRLSKAQWQLPEYRNRFLIALIIVLLLFGIAGGFLVFINENPANPDAAITASPAVPGQEFTPPATPNQSPLILALIGLSFVFLVTALIFLVKGYGLASLRSDRSLGLIIILGTLVLPQLSAFPLRFFGLEIPTNASDVMALTAIDIAWVAVFLVPLFIISAAIGLVWNWRVWLINAGIFYAIFTVFYTSLFTNGAGFFTGIVGSLGYWLEQQGVQRGSQPPYYYALIQVPVYEYLPAIGTWLAFAYYLWSRLRRSIGSSDEIPEANEEIQLSLNIGDEFESKQSPESGRDNSENNDTSAPVFPLLGYWAITSMLAFSIAGEKMPWLTFHITLPAILCTGWVLGHYVDEQDWRNLWNQ